MSVNLLWICHSPVPSWVFRPWVSSSPFLLAGSSMDLDLWLLSTYLRAGKSAFEGPVSVPQYSSLLAPTHLRGMLLAYPELVDEFGCHPWLFFDLFRRLLPLKVLALIPWISALNISIWLLLSFRALRSSMFCRLRWNGQLLYYVADYLPLIVGCWWEPRPPSCWSPREFHLPR